MAEITQARRDWVVRVLGLGLAKPSHALQTWHTQREAAVGRLKSLAAAIAGSRDAEAPDAIILIQAIIKNLTPQPDTQQKVIQLEKWLQTDDILEDAEAPNPFGVEVAIRQPLLAALADLKADFGS
jgi:hypothetical protein